MDASERLCYHFQRDLRRAWQYEGTSNAKEATSDLRRKNSRRKARYCLRSYHQVEKACRHRQRIPNDSTSNHEHRIPSEENAWFHRSTIREMIRKTKEEGRSQGRRYRDDGKERLYRLQ